MTQTESDSELASAAFRKISDRFGGEVQGACAIIAMHIWSELVAYGEPEPVVIAGYLTSATGWRRSHWWIEKDGITYDPMGDEYRNEPGFKREIAHRGNWHIFCQEYKRQAGRGQQPAREVSG